MSGSSALLLLLLGCAARAWHHHTVRLPASLGQYIEPRRCLDEEEAEPSALAAISCAAASITEGFDAGPLDAERLRAVNAALFDRLSVVYDPARTRVPNQSVQETLRRGAATCTGLSLVLVAALRSLGMPARVVGTPAWAVGDDPGEGSSCKRGLTLLGLPAS